MSDSMNGIPPVPTPTVPAGWYDDGSGRQRYWNGAAWTEHYADQQPAPQVPPGATPHQPAREEPRKSRKGLWITIGVVGGLLLLLLIGLIVAALAGIATRVADAVPDEGTPVATAPVEETDEPETDPPAEPPANSETAVFGETWEYTDGVAVTVSAPRPFEPSDTAFAEEAEAYVVFDVTIVNGSEEPYEPLVITSVQSGDTEAQEVFDSGNGLEGTPSTTVLPGREVTFQIGYGVEDPEDLVLEIMLGFEYEPAIYVSSR